MSIKLSKQFAEMYLGYRSGVCIFNYAIINNEYYTGVAAIQQFPELDFSDFEIVTINEQ